MQFRCRLYIWAKASTGGVFAILQAIAKIVLTFHLLRMQKRLDLETRV